MSSHTGYGLKVFKKALPTLLKDKRLFPCVGGVVPLNDAMIERLAHEGRLPGRQDTVSSDAAAPKHAAWEAFVDKHLDATASEGCANCVGSHLSRD